MTDLLITGLQYLAFIGLATLGVLLIAFLTMIVISFPAAVKKARLTARQQKLIREHEEARIELLEHRLKERRAFDEIAKNISEDS